MSEWNRLTESEGHALADALLKALIGVAPIHLYWDQEHHLQGHVHVGDRDLVVIAPRDNLHEPFVLTAEDWDEIRHAPGQRAGELVRRRAIHDHDEFLDRVGGFAISPSRYAGHVPARPTRLPSAAPPGSVGRSCMSWTGWNDPRPWPC